MCDLKKSIVDCNAVCVVWSDLYNHLTKSSNTAIVSKNEAPYLSTLTCILDMLPGSSSEIWNLLEYIEKNQDFMVFMTLFEV